MVARIITEYFLLVLIAALGVLQATVAYNELIGLSFFGRKIWGYVFAGLTVGPALAGLFTWNFRNATGVIEGPEQFGVFVFAVIAALTLTLAISSILKHSSRQVNDVQVGGLEAFKKEVTFFKALRYRSGGKR